MSVTSWTISGADDQPIVGNAHLPADSPRGSVIISHGFKGYKDYGFVPYLARQIAAAGFIAHRYNFSHSGMTDNFATFEKPQLFERDTWGKQITDLLAVNSAIADNTLPGAGLPCTWFGHSRGGVTTILAAAKAYDENLPALPHAIIPASSPDTSCRLDVEQRDLMRKLGHLSSPSARTGQNLRIGLPWLDEIEANPDAFDPTIAIARVLCPSLIIHGSADATIPPEAAQRLAQAAGDRARCEIIDGGSHTFDCPNPLDDDAAAPPQTQRLAQLVTTFLSA